MMNEQERLHAQLKTACDLLRVRGWQALPVIVTDRASVILDAQLSDWPFRLVREYSGGQFALVRVRKHPRWLRVVRVAVESGKTTSKGSWPPEGRSA
jgi:predicted glycosyl hydrolase (DUF1957 family)